jgi:hypothetical protein
MMGGTSVLPPQRITPEHKNMSHVELFCMAATDLRAHMPVALHTRISLDQFHSTTLPETNAQRRERNTGRAFMAELTALNL